MAQQRSAAQSNQANQGNPNQGNLATRQAGQRGVQLVPGFLPGFGLFGSLQREIDRLFEDFARTAGNGGAPAVTNLVPNIDVTENDNEILVTAELPGLERKEVDISVDGDTLTIRGEKRVEEGDGEDKQVVSERRYGVFLRMLQLPAGIDASQIEATMANGILKLRIPKPAQTQPKKIEVKEAA